MDWLYAVSAIAKRNYIIIVTGLAFWRYIVSSIMGTYFYLIEGGGNRFATYF